MAKCYLGELLYGEMLPRRVVIWRNVTEPVFSLVYIAFLLIEQGKKKFMVSGNHEYKEKTA